MAGIGGPVGNKNAAKNRPWAEAIDRALKQAKAKPKKGRATLEKLAERLIDLAASGDLAAIKEIGDRLDGRPRQSVEAEIDTGPTLTQLCEEIARERERAG